MSSRNPLGSLLVMIRLWTVSDSCPSGIHLSVGDRRRTNAVAVHLLVVPVDIVADGFLACLFEVFGFNDDVLVHRNEVLALDNKFGHWMFCYWIFQRPSPCQLLSAGAVMGQLAPKGFRPSSARRSLQAASSLM